MAATTRKPTNGTRPTSNTTLARRVDDLEKRVLAMESVVNSARQRQQQAVAAKLAQNPNQLAELESLLALAKNGAT